MNETITFEEFREKLMQLNRTYRREWTKEKCKFKPLERTLKNGINKKVGVERTWEVGLQYYIFKGRWGMQWVHIEMDEFIYRAKSCNHCFYYCDPPNWLIEVYRLDYTVLDQEGDELTDFGLKSAIEDILHKRLEKPGILSL